MKYLLSFPDKFSENYIINFDTEATFEYLVDHKVSKVYVKDLTIDFEAISDWGTVICVGAEPLKKVYNQAGITKLNGLYEEFYSKKANCTSRVGCLLDPKITMPYPEKTKIVDKAIMTLMADDKEKAVVKFHYPGNDYVELKTAFPTLDSYNTLVVDLETSSFNPISGRILGIVIAVNEEESYYFLWDSTIVPLLNKLFKGKTLIAHNAKFDWKWLIHNKVEVMENVIHDSMILAYLEGTEKEIGLKPLSMLYTPFGFYDKNLNEEKKKICRIRKIKVAEFNYGMFDATTIGEYACYDGVACYSIFNKFKHNITAPPYALMVDAVKEVGLMELNGAFIDQELLETTIENLTAKTQKVYLQLMAEVEKANGDLEINFNSPKQLAKLLYEVMGFECTVFTATGAPSTSKEALKGLDDTYGVPLVAFLLEYRSLNKFVNTYLTNIKEGIDSDGRVRTSFNLTGTTSGRLSSGKDTAEGVTGKSLNFQNIPSNDKTVKKLFIAESEDRVLVNMDLQNAELWVIGVLANEPSIINAFVNKEDIHSAMAVKVFNLDCTADEVKAKYPDARQRAKTLNFSVLYQAGAGLVAQNLDITFMEAKVLVAAWFKAFPNVRKWIDSNLNIIQTTGEVNTYFGRYRKSEEVFSNNSAMSSHHVKSLLNMLIQSVASDINLKGYCDGMKEIREFGLDVIPMALVHDSIVFTCPKTEVKQAVSIFKRHIQAVLPFYQPIGIDVEMGKSWGEVK